MKISELNKAQLIIIWISVTLLVLTFLFPPWFVSGGMPDRMPEGYAFITRPPMYGGPDYARIVLQVAAIAVVAAAAFVTAARSGNSVRAHGVDG